MSFYGNILQQLQNTFKYFKIGDSTLTANGEEGITLEGQNDITIDAYVDKMPPED